MQLAKDVITESEMLATAIAVAELHGWLVAHWYDSRKSRSKGFPDLTLVRGPSLHFVELKGQQGRLSRAQADWLAALNEAKPGSAIVVRPDTFEELLSLLRHPSVTVYELLHDK